jgi:hypothetical protein
MRSSFIPYAHEIIHFLLPNFRILSYFSPLVRSYSLTILTSVDCANMKPYLLYSSACYCLSILRHSYNTFPFLFIPFHNLSFSNPVPVPIYVLTHSLSYSLSGFARSLQERLMSLPVYDGCRPSSRYFSYNENQPDISIEEVHKHSSSSSSSYRVAAPSGMSVTSATAYSSSGINTTMNSSAGSSCGSSSNGSGNGSITETVRITEGAEVSDDSSVGVFLSKNYRYLIVFYLLSVIIDHFYCICWIKLWGRIRLRVVSHSILVMIAFIFCLISSVL